MSRKQRMQNAREAKDRKMKKVLVGLSVVLVAVLAFEVPKMMKSGNSTSAPPAATTTTGASPTATPTATPTGTAAAAVTPVANTKLPANSDAPPHPAKSQLYSFSHFSGKDPFVQQISASTTPNGSSSGTPAPQTSTGQTTAVTRNHSSRTLAVTGAASIAVNGRIQVVRVGASFPSANPLFRLVSVTHGAARIGIANGSYTSGAHTVSLTLGRTLTLVDTADGVRYRIRLVSAG